MAGWNYRIVRHRDPLPKWILLKKNTKYREEHYPNGYIEWFALHEVYYNDKGKPDGIAQDPCKLIMDEFSKKEFNWVMRHMRMAKDRPVIDYETSKEI